MIVEEHHVDPIQVESKDRSGFKELEKQKNEAIIAKRNPSAARTAHVVLVTLRRRNTTGWPITSSKRVARASCTRAPSTNVSSSLTMTKTLRSLLAY
jgi:hypothetical protein